MSVRVEHGVNAFEGELAGKTVAELRAQLRQLLNIGANATAMVDGQEVDESYQVPDESTVEFIRLAGVKGFC